MSNMYTKSGQLSAAALRKGYQHKADVNYKDHKFSTVLEFVDHYNMYRVRLVQNDYNNLNSWHFYSVSETRKQFETVLEAVVDAAEKEYLLV